MLIPATSDHGKTDATKTVIKYSTNYKQKKKEVSIDIEAISFTNYQTKCKYWRNPYHDSSANIMEMRYFVQLRSLNNWSDDVYLLTVTMGYIFAEFLFPRKDQCIGQRSRNDSWRHYPAFLLSRESSCRFYPTSFQRFFSRFSPVKEEKVAGFQHASCVIARVEF